MTWRTLTEPLNEAANVIMTLAVLVLAIETPFGDIGRLLGNSDGCA